MDWLKDLRRSPKQPHNPHQPPPVPARKPQDGSTPENQTLFQSFEWHTPSQPPPPSSTHSPHSHYARLTRILPSLADIGVTKLWLPPGCKANNADGSGNGYDVYDIWDLGEFDQKYARSTKWGSREELADLQGQMRRVGVEGIWDAVLNHKTAGDTTQECWAVEVDGEDRRIETCAPKKIEPWIKYDFPGRKGKYSKFQWRAEHFNGTDWDQRAQKNAIYKIVDDPATFPKPGANQQQQQPVANSAMNGMNRLARFAGKVAGLPPRRPGKGWAEDVDDLHGNYDYLMFSNIDYTHPAVRQDVTKWGEWMIHDIGIDGFRLDAVQHFSYNFTRDWITAVQEASRNKYGKNAFIVGEIWTNEVKRIIRWLDVVGQGAYCYDSPLLYNFSRISQDVVTGSRNADLRTILRDCLLYLRPQSAVTLVTNHDTQPGQASATPLDARLKALFYAFILLRAEGLPCVFWGDMYGIQNPKHSEPPACISPTSPRSLLPDLILARRLFAYGEQRDYFDAASCIGFTRSGTHDREGCAVIMSIGPPKAYTQKKMQVGRPGEAWMDVLAEQGQRAEVEIDGKGCGVFPCKGWSASVFVRKDAQGTERFPVPFNLDVYR